MDSWHSQKWKWGQLARQQKEEHDCQCLCKKYSHHVYTSIPTSKPGIPELKCIDKIFEIPLALSSFGPHLCHLVASFIVQALARVRTHMREVSCRMENKYFVCDRPWAYSWASLVSIGAFPFRSARSDWKIVALPKSDGVGLREYVDPTRKPFWAWNSFEQINLARTSSCCCDSCCLSSRYFHHLLHQLVKISILNCNLMMEYFLEA